MLSRAYSFTISSINIAIGLILLCFNTEFYHNPSWKITIEQQQKYLLGWNMAFALIIIFYNLILILLVDSLILSKRAHLFFTYGIICCIFLVAINLTNIILLVFVSSEIHVPKSSSLYINIFLFTLVFFTNLFDWLVCYDLCFYDKC
ncbi:unnamed protein product [Rotaria magnacalcarata]|uniref:Uncharacterized protein n=1 Tax=Rotaria magnacalcarata TaxID=392030 RepID=A0A819S9Z8_9BILA|nr:unnamed protein product [Rotaria magnacalcarata]CAF4049274.1 unnamed protein product [Rotaria magnacalcarata]CAF4072945.1 unnamed protein product [Rotaria magnacalcarata]